MPPLATPIPICSADDPRLAPFQQIRERDLVGRAGRFIAEGEVVLRMLLKSTRFGTETILLSKRRAAHMAEFLALIPEHIPVLVAEDALIEAVAGFHLHRGVLAVGLRGAPETAAALINGLPAQATVLVGIGIANHDNMGGLFRNAAAFGVGAMLLDQTSCDPLYRKAIRVSVGGVLQVPFARGGDGAALITALQEAGFQTLALTPGGALELSDVQRAPRTALVVGAEGPGLPAGLMAQMHKVRIDIADGFDSLNVATSAAIALYGLTRTCS
jgi:tRNA G18 (ribose-2'-O)-methylase SpoU